MESPHAIFPVHWDHEPVRIPLNRPSGIFSPTGGEGWDEGLTNAETAAKMAEAELLEFLFLPGFSMKAAVTEISGRGVGLDVVQNMVKQVRGSVRVSTQPGQGTRFLLQLPVTLSVVRTLLAE